MVFSQWTEHLPFDIKWHIFQYVVPRRDIRSMLVTSHDKYDGASDLEVILSCKIADRLLMKWNTAYLNEHHIWPPELSPDEFVEIYDNAASNDESFNSMSDEVKGTITEWVFETTW